MKRYRQIVNSLNAPGVNDLWLHDGILKYFGKSGWTPLLGVDDTSSVSVPTKLSELENDSGYITGSSVKNIEVVTELPASPDDTTLYLVVSDE